MPVPLTEHFKGFYSTLFLVQKKMGWWVEAGDISEEVQPVHPSRELQVGILTDNYSSGQARRLDNFSRTTGHLPACSNPPFIPEVLKVCGGASPPTIPRPDFWPVHLLKGVSGDIYIGFSPLRERGLRVYHYLSNILLLASDPNQLISHREVLLQSLMELRWLINIEKSQLLPMQQMIYLGTMFNTQQGTLPSLKAKILFQRMIRVTQSSHLTASQCLSLIGMMLSCISLVPWSHWHLRYFHTGFLAQWKRQQLSQMILLTALMHRSLHW